jgi:hypothetical protein
MGVPARGATTGSNRPGKTTIIVGVHKRVVGTGTGDTTSVVTAGRVPAMAVAIPLMETLIVSARLGK